MNTSGWPRTAQNQQYNRIRALCFIAAFGLGANTHECNARTRGIILVSQRPLSEPFNSLRAPNVEFGDTLHHADTS
jgi:hypothetical protein